MVSIIVPVYNKGSVLFKTLSSLIKNLHHASISDFEIIVINDGSTDNSFEEAVRFKKFNRDTDKLKIYHYTKNVGKGFALRFGFTKCMGDPVVFLDGDMDIDTKQVVSSLTVFRSRSPDMVIGSKYHKKSRVYYPAIRFFYSIVLKIIIKILFNLSISDTQVGLKIYRRKLLSQVFPRLIIKRFATDLELLVVANKLGFTHVAEVPIVIKHSTRYKTSVGFKEPLQFLIDVAAIFYRKHILKYYSETRNADFFASVNFQAA